MEARGDKPVASFAGERPDLDRIHRVLLVRLRSIGDTVLMTPCITALKQWRPDVQIDVLVEPFCAPVLEAHPDVNEVIVVDRSLVGRARTGRQLHARGYDLAVNLHGGTSAAMLAVASGARYRVGFEGYRSPWLANCRVTSSHHVWKRTDVHTVEHQLALIAGIGVPVDFAGPTSLASSPGASQAVDALLADRKLQGLPIAVIHPEASLESKTWPAERFAQLGEWLRVSHGLVPVVVGMDEATVSAAAGKSGVALAGLPLAETIALIERAALFVGNDSGPAHIAAAFARPLVVIFGASNADLWRPWSAGPWNIVSAPVASGVALDEVSAAVDELMSATVANRG